MPTALGGALSSTNLNGSIFITKCATGFCGVRHVMARNKQKDTATCPRCGAHENTHHVLQCDGAGTQEVWNQSLTNLDQWLTDHGTNPNLPPNY
jgi:hypothetical protein